MSSSNYTGIVQGEAEGFSRERRHKPGRVVTGAIAFLEICHRDFLVSRREFIAFLFQFMIQPFFFLFIFGKVLPMIGTARPDYAASLLPGMVALTTFMAAYCAASWEGYWSSRLPPGCWAVATRSEAMISG